MIIVDKVLSIEKPQRLGKQCGVERLLPGKARLRVI
jgi:hypothetical protein